MLSPIQYSQTVTFYVVTSLVLCKALLTLCYFLIYLLTGVYGHTTLNVPDLVLCTSWVQ